MAITSETISCSSPISPPKAIGISSSKKADSHIRQKQRLRAQLQEPSWETCYDNLDTYTLTKFPSMETTKKYLLRDAGPYSLRLPGRPLQITRTYSGPISLQDIPVAV